MEEGMLDQPIVGTAAHGRGMNAHDQLSPSEGIMLLTGQATGERECVWVGRGAAAKFLVGG